jgi:NAD(P)-dependent dehydrogenase (short-subunit alcohol dehydrogenase family)
MPTALVTGSNSGLGLALSREYLARGWRVLATHRPSAHIDDLLALAQEYGDQLRLMHLDLARDGDVLRLADQIGSEAIDVMVASAAWARKCRGLDALDYQTWETTMRVNAYGPLALAASLRFAVARSEQKTIVVISSEMGSIAANDSGGRYAYRASKAAANMIVRTLAHDLHALGVIVVSVHPGWLRTQLGGPDAPVQPAEAAAAIATLIDGLEPRHSGRFFDRHGDELPW